MHFKVGSRSPVTVKMKLFKVGSRGPVTVKIKVFVTTVNNSSQLLLILSHKEFHLRGHIGFDFDIVT